MSIVRPSKFGDTAAGDFMNLMSTNFDKAEPLQAKTPAVALLVSLGVGWLAPRN